MRWCRYMHVASFDLAKNCVVGGLAYNTATGPCLDDWCIVAGTDTASAEVAGQGKQRFGVQLARRHCSSTTIP